MTFLLLEYNASHGELGQYKGEGVDKPVWDFLAKHTKDDDSVLMFRVESERYVTFRIVYGDKDEIETYQRRLDHNSKATKELGYVGRAR